MIFKNKRILVTGGTGSLGKVLIQRLLNGEQGKPKKIIVFSRDEAKQHEMRMEYKHISVATDEIIYRNFKELLEFRIGDVRDFHSISSALYDADIVFNAAALKQVPTCEYFPYEAVETNIHGAENIVRAVQLYNLPIETVVCISTDKACKPINVMGMSKAIQERIFIQANIRCPKTRFVCVRYGNVLASRGSVIPLFHEQIRIGGPITITSKDMTRFLLSLENAVDIIFDAVKAAKPGETFVPEAPSAKIIDIASLLIGNKKIDIVITGIRPGEKIHEILISEEECVRTRKHDKYFVIDPIHPELRVTLEEKQVLKREYSSADNIMDGDALYLLLKRENLLIPA